MDNISSRLAGLNINPASSSEGPAFSSTHNTSGKDNTVNNQISSFNEIHENNDDSNLPNFSSLHIHENNTVNNTNDNVFSFGTSNPSSYKGTKKFVKPTIKSTPVIVPPPIPSHQTNSTSNKFSTFSSTFSTTTSDGTSEHENVSASTETFDASTKPNNTSPINTRPIAFTKIPHPINTPSPSKPKIVSSSNNNTNNTVPTTNSLLPSDLPTPKATNDIPTNPYTKTTNYDSNPFISIPSNNPSSSKFINKSNDQTMDYSPLPVPQNTIPSTTTAATSSPSTTENIFSMGKTPPKRETIPKKPLSRDNSQQPTNNTTFTQHTSVDNSPSNPWSPSTETNQFSNVFLYPSNAKTPPTVPTFNINSTFFSSLSPNDTNDLPSVASPTSKPAFPVTRGFLNAKSDSSSKKKYAKKVNPPEVGNSPTNNVTPSDSVKTPVKATFSSNISPPTTPASESSPSVKRISYEELISTARAAFSSQDFALAHKKFTDALAIKSNDAMSLSNRAACAMMLGRHDEAIVDCARATDVDASYSPAYLRCARAYLALGEIKAAMEQVESAEVAALNTGGTTGAKHREQARTLAETIKTIVIAESNAENAVRRKAWGQALDSISLSVNSHNEARNSLSGIALKARALVGLRKYQDAMELCSDTLPPQLEGANEFLACRPRPSSTAMNTAIIFAHAAWCTEDTDRALRILAAILRCNASHLLALRLQKRIEKCELNRKNGNERYRNNEYRKAIDFYTKAITAATRVLPEDEDDDEDIADDEEFHQEIKYGSAGIPCFPARANLYANRAAAYMALTEYESASNDCTLALDDVSLHLKARLRRARIYTVSKKYGLAFADYRTVLTSLRGGQIGIPIGGKLDVQIENIQKELDDATRTQRNEQEEERKRKEEEERQRKKQQQRYTSYRYNSQYDDDEDEDDDDEEEEDTDTSWFYPKQHTNNHQSNKTKYNNNNNSRTNNKTSWNKPTSQRYVPPPIPPCPPDYYTILGIEKNFTEVSLKKAYKLKALNTHPDKPGGSEEAFKKVGEAYAVLSDYTRRLAHDADVEDWKRKYGHRK